MATLFGKEVRPYETSLINSYAAEPFAIVYLDDGKVTLSGEEVGSVYYFDYKNNVLFEDHTKIYDDGSFAAELGLSPITKHSIDSRKRRIWKLTRSQRRKFRPILFPAVYEYIRMRIKYFIDKWQPEQETGLEDYEPLISEKVTTAKILDPNPHASEPPSDARGGGKIDPFDGAQVAKHYKGLT